MALTRRSGQRFHATVWPGFVDALSTLLLVLIFVLTIFMIVEGAQIQTIGQQEDQLDRLSGEVDKLAVALGVEQQAKDGLETRVEGLGSDLASARQAADAQAQVIDRLQQDLAQRDGAIEIARGEIASYEEQVAALLADRDAARGQVTELTGKVGELDAARSALDTALAAARSEIDAKAEAARLDAARREALEALTADLRAKADATAAELDTTRSALSAQEAARVAEAEAARLLREKLESADAELTAMTLTLEERRREAEQTLTLLAAARARAEEIDERLMAALLDGEATPEAMAAARTALDEARARLAAEGASDAELRRRLAEAVAAKISAETGARLSEAEVQARLLATAQQELADVEAASAEDQRRLALLNQQVAGLESQLGRLQGLLDDSAAKDAAAQVQIENLGQRLNVALARAASEERQRAELEAERARALEVEAKRLEAYQSEFFGRLREVLGDRAGVRIEGDRFVFSSEVLFASGSADLSPAGQASIANVARTLQEVAAVIPPGINWIIRVDGHTDDVPVSPTSLYRDNWELSQARALSVVRYMIDSFGFPPGRLAAAGFGEFQPIDPGGTPEARAKNRRIELKLTDR